MNSQLRLFALYQLVKVSTHKANNLNILPMLGNGVLSYVVLSYIVGPSKDSFTQTV